jgi:NAD(P)-dependent dehydrogenase (short-subunit alcohol dehydrogenase family)
MPSATTSSRRDPEAGAIDASGPVALVTGAGRGLGWGIALAFARAGARVCAIDLNEADLQRAARDIDAEGGEAFAAQLDVADREGFARLADDVVARWGRIDVLVHSAIYMPLVRFEDLDADDWRRQFDVGLGGLFNGVKAVWEPMVRQRHGHVIGIASGSSLRGYPEEVAYCAIKHAQEGMVKALALEAQEHGIALNTMGPGAPIKTTRLTWDELAALPAERHAAWADPAELGRAFVWLAAQPPARYSGLRFDAGPIVATLDREGEHFAFAAEKVTLYPDDLRERMAWREQCGSS